ncbi:MAG: PKD domain-containing protein, partial [Thermoplasmata archaeon]|nr:PKD domain-containing protein [Thermoplasmata archaeon]
RGPTGWRRWLVVAAGVAIMLAFPALLLAGDAAGASASTSSPYLVTVTATPSNGSLPLTVTFTAAVSSGAPSSVAWTFGDGKSWAGAGDSGLSVSHQYVSVGSFVAVATVSEPSGSSSGSAFVNVGNGPLVVVIAATPVNGTLPMTVTFRAVVAGGTGTYTTFDWGFGDGGYGAGPLVQYVYHYAGHFTATLTVIDTANDSSTTSFPVAVSATSTGGPISSTSGLSSVTGPAALATAGIVGAGLTWGVFRFGRRHRTSATPGDVESEVLALPPGTNSLAASPPEASAGATGTSASVAASPSVGSSSLSTPLTANSAPAAAISEGGTAAVPSIGSIPRILTPTVEVDASAPRTVAEEPRRWSKEIVAYLGGLPTLGPDDIPTTDWTQKGMSERLGTGQNQVSNVLRRLVAAGIVLEDLQHVQGQPRRLKVYRLSMRGEALAREVRRRRAGQNPNFLRREW